MLYKFIRIKKIKVNKKRAEISFRLREGDVVDLYIKEEFLITPRGNENGEGEYNFKNIVPNIKIVYEDGNILLVDKKPGVIVHPDDSEEINTLINHITAYLYAKGEYSPDAENSFAPALCNRIDRNTGGLVICSKNAETLRIINQKIKNGEIEKTYLCLVHGIPPKKREVLTAYHRKNAGDNLVAVRKNKFAGSKIIKTAYSVIKENREDNTSLLEVNLITGRTHQIRAHLAYAGYPLVGDGKYGVNREIRQDRKNGFYYQALYSYAIKFAFAPGLNSGVLDYLNGKSFFADDDGVYFM